MISSVMEKSFDANQNNNFKEELTNIIQNSLFHPITIKQLIFLIKKIHKIDLKEQANDLINALPIESPFKVQSLIKYSLDNLHNKNCPGGGLPCCNILYNKINVYYLSLYISKELSEKAYIGMFNDTILSNDAFTLLKVLYKQNDIFIDKLQCYTFITIEYKLYIQYNSFNI